MYLVVSFLFRSLIALFIPAIIVLLLRDHLPGFTRGSYCMDQVLSQYAT